MTGKQQINHGIIQRVCYLNNGFFIPFIWVTPFQVYSFNFPVFFTKNNKLWNERKKDFICI